METDRLASRLVNGWMLGGLLTYVLNVLDTWSGSAGPLVKAIISLTLDPFLAAIWPITWMLWAGMAALGQSTPLRIFGF